MQGMEGSKVVWGLGSATLLQPIVYIFLLVEPAKEDTTRLVGCFVVGLVLAVEAFGVKLVELEQGVNNTPAGDSVVDNFLGKGSCRVIE